MRATFIPAAFPIILLAGPIGSVEPAAAQGRSLTGAIRGYECGDNCYLTIVDGAGKAHTGLCEARACEPWNREAAMPARFKGKRVTVTLGQGTQVDASGKVMGRMTAFRTLAFQD